MNELEINSENKKRELEAQLKNLPSCAKFLTSYP